MKYLSARPQSLFIIQVVALVLVLFGFIFVEYNWVYFLISVLCFYAYSILGISMTLHRYYSHKSFHLNLLTKWILTFIAVLSGRGSPLGWAYVHRLHHATSDTEKDPHSPNNNNFKFFGFKPIYDPNKKINFFIVKELLTNSHINIDKYYMLVIFGFLLFMGLINPALVFYLWALPVLVVSITQIAFNYFAHKHGYRNFETRDKSTNNPYLWLFIWGDAWHNNHHAHAEKISTKVKWHEWDPLSAIISILRTDK